MTRTERQTENRQRIQLQRLLLSPVDCRGEWANTDGILKSILNMFVYNDKVNSRLTRTPCRLVHSPKYSKLEHTTLYRGLLYYNKVGEDIKTLPLKQFKTQVKMFIKQKMPLDRFNTYRDYI